MRTDYSNRGIELKKYFFVLTALSFLGAVLSGILLFKHYFPQSGSSFFSCGSGIIDTCVAVSQSDAGTFFSIPLAAFGLLFYIFMIMNILIVQFSEELEKPVISVLFSFLTVSLLIDAVLGSILVKQKSVCSLCVATYCVNAAMLFILFFYIRKHHGLKASFLALSEVLFSVEKKDMTIKYLYATATIFICSSVIFFTNNLSLVNRIKNHPDSKLTEQLNDFYNEKKLTLKFPETDLKLGSDSAPVKIRVYIDFLCSACHSFFTQEKYFLSKYNGKIQILYYHYPLDSACNKYMNESVYKNSCIASRYMEYSSKNGFFSRYIYEHFRNYDEIAHSYTEKKASEILRATGISDIKYNEEEIKKKITEHIEFAEKIKIEATPTVIINGRKIVGVPPVPFLEAVINRELKSKNN